MTQTNVQKESPLKLKANALAILIAFSLLSVFVNAADPTANSGAPTAVVTADTGLFLMIGVMIVIVAAILLFVFRKPIINTILGLLAFALLNLIGIHVPVNLVTILITAIFGLVGIGVLVILTVLHILV